MVGQLLLEINRKDYVQDGKAIINSKLYEHTMKTSKAYMKPDYFFPINVYLCLGDKPECTCCRQV